ncbi:HAMP domain-containing histidine kinase [Lederbergia sp. NSJ-179]|uniref:sensor histidine kinase n=1 Tax=Lederbergia sp. NSJ-179 TaxID=2931402 RepID=UPI001FCFE0F0|nr:HAMP domain-containing sensor histidine kinase [Lederbergia sp. NSJ-179]MCJ7840089.1 HAMP domain-containing histidine kinase [Lederbergia sp. NSJ-179]
MSIKRRLILSNIAMVIVPVIALLLVEMILGIFLIYVFHMKVDANFERIFVMLRWIALIVILMLTNGLITYFVSKSIIEPVGQLTNAAQKISKGQLHFQIEPKGEDEIGQLAKTFEQMRRELEEAGKMRSKYEENRKELIANISHDLKTPITSIKGYVEGIRDGVANTPEKMDRYLQTIYTKALDLDHRINELFLYSKLDVGSVPFQFEVVDVHKYLLDLTEELQFELEREDVTIAYDTELADSYRAKVDREQLKRAITNILHNSIKYMDKEEKQIQIRMQLDADHIRIRIEDNGSGIPQEDLPYVFDRFYRVDPSRNTAKGGTGLGLAIVKRIVEGHGGKIWAESEMGKGTSISFTLERVKADEKNINH